MVRKGAEVMGYKYSLGTPHEEVGLELGFELDLRIKYLEQT